MTDGPARPMTGIRGAGFPGTAQVHIIRLMPSIRGSFSTLLPVRSVAFQFLKKVSIYRFEN